MAFPTTVPAEGTVHREDGAPFVVHNGKWERRKGCRIFTSNSSGTANLKTLDVHPDKDVQRITYKAAMQISGGGETNIQLNVSKNGTWLDGGGGTYARVSGNLSDGPNRWRKNANNWKSLRDFDSYGFYVNWVEGGWGVGSGKRAYLHFDLQNLDNSWSIFTWKFFFARSTGYPGLVLGQGWLHATPAEITQIRIHSREKWFSNVGIIAESY
jgi:hypothetical protein